MKFSWHVTFLDQEDHIPTTGRYVISPTGSFRAYVFWTLSEARSWLYQRRFLRPRPHFSPFFKLYMFFLCTIPDFCDFSSLRTIFCKICRFFVDFSMETLDFAHVRQISTDFFRNFAEFQHFAKNGAKVARVQKNLRNFGEKKSKISLQNFWNFVRKNVCSKCLRWWYWDPG